MSVTQMSNYLFVISCQLMFYKTLRFSRKQQKINHESNQFGGRHANDFHESRGPTLKGFTEDFYRNRKPAFLQQMYYKDINFKTIASQKVRSVTPCSDALSSFYEYSLELSDLCL